LGLSASRTREAAASRSSAFGMTACSKTQGIPLSRSSDSSGMLALAPTAHADLVDVKGTLPGHNNAQGSALGIKIDFTQPYAVSGSKGRYELRGAANLQSCIVKYLPVCGPSVAVTFNAMANFADPWSPATASSSNNSVFSIHDTP
ncbi:hypothetical protein, partial [Kitasatospora sp. NPDC005856]|uniref:hypothetical protein n=1 Tax=Kitasatospora sp. NPDC005856 TaxID=3154566 RepID=UPI00340405CB